ncbi:hypothetical protein U9M48_011437 [Paspalum notatum var. saurae]|uniref:Uncharacterized protein n=1 Tax=Paspalum notatum var. saurae TaxID=547442 RepID=A0AAQ3WHI9_PASNO
MLGFLCSYRSAGEGRNTCFVPTAISALRRSDHRVFRADSRHYRVVLYCDGSYSYCKSCVSGIVVWDPIADERLELPSAPLSVDSLRLGSPESGYGCGKHCLRTVHRVEKHCLRIVDSTYARPGDHGLTAVVLCTAVCDHTDCHRSPF